MKIVFMGTPDFAAVSLQALLSSSHTVLGVFCQPDRPSNRGMKVAYSPVKQLALEHQIPVFQPEKMKDGTAYQIVKDLNPEILVVVAYGRILPEDMLQLPKYGAINVHGSLLPKYRGSAPIQWSVLNGDEYGGVTTMHLSKEMDAGNLIYAEKTPIGEYETSGELFDRLSTMGAALLLKTLDDIEKGIAPSIPQDPDEVTYAPMLSKEMSPIDWTKTSREISKHICGLQPWPVATAEIGGQQLKVFSAVRSDRSSDRKPGTVIQADGQGIEVVCGDSKTVVIKEVQAAGKKRMSAGDYVRGHHLEVG